jgi:hypothetical protein
MILDEEMGPRLQMMTQITGPGYGPELRCSKIETEARLVVEEEDRQRDGEEKEEWDFGIFE